VNYLIGQVYCEVQPKRMALKDANDELAAAHQKLAAVEAKVNYYGNLLI